jgi:hypothetical protein
MGAWGTAIFSDDTAADTRDLFTDLVAEGLTPTEATERLVAEGELLSDKDEANVFWLALAATQWKLGRLIDTVRDRALAIIDSGSNLRRWEQDSPRSVVTQRKKQLAELREQLLSPQPAPRKLKARVKASTDFQPGDIVSFRLDDKTALRFCVIRLWGDRGGVYSDICLLELDDGTPFTKSRITLEEMMGPHYTLLSHEPADGITILQRGVELPPPTLETFKARNQIPIDGCACTWKDFPRLLREVLAKLGWE